MREGHLSSITGTVDLSPDVGTEGALRATVVSPSTGGAEDVGKRLDEVLYAIPRNLASR